MYLEKFKNFEKKISSSVINFFNEGYSQDAVVTILKLVAALFTPISKLEISVEKISSENNYLLIKFIDLDFNIVINKSTPYLFYIEKQGRSFIQNFPDIYKEYYSIKFKREAIYTIEEDIFAYLENNPLNDRLIENVLSFRSDDLIVRIVNIFLLELILFVLEGPHHATPAFMSFATLGISSVLPLLDSGYFYVNFRRVGRDLDFHISGYWFELLAQNKGIFLSNISMTRLNRQIRFPYYKVADPDHKGQAELLVENLTEILNFLTENGKRSKYKFLRVKEKILNNFVIKMQEKYKINVEETFASLVDIFKKVKEGILTIEDIKELCKNIDFFIEIYHFFFLNFDSSFFNIYIYIINKIIDDLNSKDFVDNNAISLLDTLFKQTKVFLICINSDEFSYHKYLNIFNIFLQYFLYRNIEDKNFDIYPNCKNSSDVCDAVKNCISYYLFFVNNLLTCIQGQKIFNKKSFLHFYQSAFVCCHCQKFKVLDGLSSDEDKYIAAIYYYLLFDFKKYNLIKDAILKEDIKKEMPDINDINDKLGFNFINIVTDDTHFYSELNDIFYGRASYYIKELYKSLV